MIDKGRNKSLEDELKIVFKNLDKDKSGAISAEELHRIANELGENITREEAKIMIKHADSNNDGYVSYEELKEFFLRFAR